MGYWDVGPYDNQAAQEILDAVRRGAFSMEQLRFSFSQGGLADADMCAYVIALIELLGNDATRPEGISRAMVRAIATKDDNVWLHRQRLKILSPQGSGLYALWEATGQLNDWLNATVTAGQPLIRFR